MYCSVTRNYNVCFLLKTCFSVPVLGSVLVLDMQQLRSSQEESQKNQSNPPKKNKRGKTCVCRSVPIRESFRGRSSYRERKKT